MKKMLAVAGLAVLLTCVQSNAGVSIFDSASTWESAVTSPTSPLTFDGIASENSSLWLPTGLTLGGINFSSLAPSDLFAINGAYYPGNSVLSAQVLNPSGGTATLQITLSTAASGVAFEYGGAESLGNYTISLSNGDSVLRTANSGTLSYLGLVSTTPFTTITISSVDDMINLDNFRIGSVVPEPSSLAMILAGFGLLGLLRWRQAER